MMVEINAARFQSRRVKWNIKTRIMATIRETAKDLVAVDRPISERLDANKVRMGYEAKMKRCSG